MKKTICLMLITLGLWSCNSLSSKKEGKSTADSSKTELASKSQSTIVIKDSSQYDQAFIKGLSGYKDPLQLIGNTIIAGSDTTYFPEEFPLNKTVNFKAAKDHKKYMLSVTRTNLTNLSYSFQLSDEKDQLIDSKSGNAVLGPMFFLASETDQDTQTGEWYASNEYWDITNNCWFAVRIGQGKDSHQKQRAMINYGCEDKNKPNVNLEGCPTLRAE